MVGPTRGKEKDKEKTAKHTENPARHKDNTAKHKDKDNTADRAGGQGDRTLEIYPLVGLGWSIGEAGDSVIIATRHGRTAWTTRSTDTTPCSVRGHGG